MVDALIMVLHSAHEKGKRSPDQYRQPEKSIRPGRCNQLKFPARSMVGTCNANLEAHNHWKLARLQRHSSSFSASQASKPLSQPLCRPRSRLCDHCHATTTWSHRKANSNSKQPSKPDLESCARQFQIQIQGQIRIRTRIPPRASIRRLQTPVTTCTAVAAAGSSSLAALVQTMSWNLTKSEFRHLHCSSDFANPGCFSACPPVCPSLCFAHDVIQPTIHQSAYPSACLYAKIGLLAGHG